MATSETEHATGRNFSCSLARTLYRLGVGLGLLLMIGGVAATIYDNWNPRLPTLKEVGIFFTALTLATIWIWAYEKQKQC